MPCLSSTGSSSRMSHMVEPSDGRGPASMTKSTSLHQVSPMAATSQKSAT